MENAETILVIFLSTFLAIFLFLSIIATVKFISVLNHFERVGQKAEAIADKAESVADFFSKASGPVMIGNFIAKITDAFSSNKSNKKR